MGTLRSSCRRHAQWGASASTKHTLELHWHTEELLQVAHTMRSFCQYKAHSWAPLAHWGAPAGGTYNEEPLPVLLRLSVELHGHTEKLLQVARTMRSVCQYLAHSGASLAHWGAPAGGPHNEELLPVWSTLGSSMGTLRSSRRWHAQWGASANTRLTLELHWHTEELLQVGWGGRHNEELIPVLGTLAQWRASAGGRHTREFFKVAFNWPESVRKNKSGM